MWRDIFEYLKLMVFYISNTYEKVERWLYAVSPVLLLLIRATIFVAFVGIISSHVIAIWHNKANWMQKTNSNLFFSYFCGSGQYQRKLIYNEAHILLHNYKWCYFSFAGAAHRIGDISGKSKAVLFVLSIVRLPVSAIGMLEMIIRNAVGTVWLLFASFVHWLVLLCLNLISLVLIPVGRIVDKAMRVKQYCSKCYAEFTLPRFACPFCGNIHDALAPSDTGILFAKCQCGKFIPTFSLLGRAGLAAVCPKCGSQLASANAKQFSIQLIGGNTTGKTAFLAAFQHIYLGISSSASNIVGQPLEGFEYLESTYFNGTTEPSSTTEVGVYNFIHNTNNHIRQSNLVFYDVPDEVILSGLYERNPLNFGYANGIVLVIDPLSSAMVRGECLSNGDLTAGENYSRDDVEDLIIQFIHQFSRIVGRSAKKMIKVPIAVVVNKNDISSVKKEIGFSEISIRYNENPGIYNQDINNAINEVCREYILKIGMANMVNNLESIFSNVRYFSASAIGHSSIQGRAFEPVGIINPVAWIGKIGNAEMEDTLLRVLSIISNDNHLEQVTVETLTERYREAEKFFSDELFDEATKAFAALGEYKDAPQKLITVKETRYKKAVTQYNEGNLGKAEEEFLKLDTYRDSKSWLQKSKYSIANTLLDNKQFDTAITKYEELGGYKDAANQKKECLYRKAESMVDNGSCVQAVDIYHALGNYKESSEKPKRLIGDLIKKGVRYGLEFGPYKWQMVKKTGENALLVTEAAVASRPYHLTQESVVWKKCSVRSYLNSTIYNKFDAGEKQIILESTIENTSSNEHGISDEEATKDFLFLLSIDEVEQITIAGEKAGFWWLRSPGSELSFASIIDENGRISKVGKKVSTSNGLVRPALWIRLN